MPAGWIAAGAALYGAINSHNATNKAANASQNATNSAIGEQRREFNINQQNQQPYVSAGQNAVSMLTGLNSGNMSAFHASPDYQFTLGQGLQALDRSAAARGNLLSGGHSADVLKYATGLADQQYGNYYNRLYGLAGLGLGSAQNIGSAGQNMAGNVGNLLTGNAARQGGFYYDNANTLNNLIGNGLQAWGQYQGSQGQPIVNYSGISGGGNAGGAGGLLTGSGSLS